MKVVMTFGVLAAIWALSMQEPEKAPPPQSQQSQEPQPGTVPTAIPGQHERSPLEGVYVLRTRVDKSAFDTQVNRGYVAITRRHMLVVLAAAGSDPDYPLLRAGVRTWAKNKDRVDTVIELGFFTDEDGEIHVEAPGTKQVRRIDVIRGMLRIWQDEQSFLEFERLE